MSRARLAEKGLADPPWPPPPRTGPAGGRVGTSAAHTCCRERGFGAGARSSACAAVSARASLARRSLPPSLPRLPCRVSSLWGAGGGCRLRPQRAPCWQHFRKRNWSRENKGAAQGALAGRPQLLPRVGTGGWAPMPRSSSAQADPRPRRKHPWEKGGGENLHTAPVTRTRPLVWQEEEIDNVCPPRLINTEKKYLCSASHHPSRHPPPRALLPLGLTCLWSPFEILLGVASLSGSYLLPIEQFSCKFRQDGGKIQTQLSPSLIPSPHGQTGGLITLMHSQPRTFLFIPKRLNKHLTELLEHIIPCLLVCKRLKELGF